MANHNGRDVLEQVYHDYFHANAAHLVVHVDELRVIGEIAFDRATFQVAARPKAGGTAVTSSGRVFEVWGKDPAERWKAMRVMVNSEN